MGFGCYGKSFGGASGSDLAVVAIDRQRSDGPS